MTPHDLQRLASLRAILVSHSFGYGGDLMYFGEIFRNLRELVPHMAVAVDSGQVFRNPYGIALLPFMKLRRIRLRRTAPGGERYDGEVAVPDPMLLHRLIARPVDVYLTIEFTPPALMTIVAAALRPRRRVVLLIESDPEARGGSSNRVVRRIKRWAVSRANIIQTNNEQGRRYLVEDLRAQPDKVRVAPYLTSRPPGPKPVIEQRTGPLRLLFVNSINPRKGLRQFVDALAMLKPEVRNAIRFTVVGDGSERAELEVKCTKLGLADVVRFVGHKFYDQLGAFYAEADVLIIPSLADYRSLAGFEGLGYGLALLASCHDGATHETLMDGENGFVIDPHDAPTTARHLTTVVRDRDLLLRMRERSARLYREKFSLELAAQNIAHSMLEALDR